MLELSVDRLLIKPAGGLGRCRHPRRQVLRSGHAEAARSRVSQPRMPAPILAVTQSGPPPPPPPPTLTDHAVTATRLRRHGHRDTGRPLCRTRLGVSPPWAADQALPAARMPLSDTSIRGSHSVSTTCHPADTVACAISFVHLAPLRRRDRGIRTSVGCATTPSSPLPGRRRPTGPREHPTPGVCRC